MSAYFIRIELDTEPTCKPGDEVAGTVSWNQPDVPTVGELRLRWTTSGKGHPDDKVVKSFDLVDLEPTRPDQSGGAGPYRGVVSKKDKTPLRAEDARRFRFAMPQEPYSFVGKLVSLEWQLQARTSSHRDSVTLTLSPTGEPIRLARVGKQEL